MNRRTWALILLGAVVAVVVAAWVNAGETFPGRLDPRGVGPQGAQAVARVLEDQGVAVHIVRSNAEFLAAPVDNDTTVLVSDATVLGPSTIEDLLLHARFGEVVVVEPEPRITEELGYDGSPYFLLPEDDIDARCDRFSGLKVDVDEAIAYRPTRASCFQTEAGALVVAVDEQSLRTSVQLSYLGAGGILENRQILHGDNAAVALRLLGAHRQLVWYVPSASDLTAGDEVSLSALLPSWTVPGLWTLGLAVLGLIVWRARRLGRLATEPLPVTIKAIETTHSRGRLYRKANDRGHAAQALRRAAHGRVADRLGLPHHAAPAELIEAVASATGRPRDELTLLLYGAPPAGDRDLIQLATSLAALDDQLRKAPR